MGGDWLVRAAFGVAAASAILLLSGRAFAHPSRDSQDSRTPAGFPLTVDLIPGKLKVKIYDHEIHTRAGALPCWSYVTDGLRPLGQKELIFTFSRLPGEEPESYPKNLLHFLNVVYGLAQQGRIVDVGGFTELNDSDLLAPGFPGVAYIRGQALDGIPETRDSLAGVLITGDELEVARAFGMTRVMSNLGRAYRFYPCSPWTDRARTSVVTMKSMEGQSLLAKTRRTWVEGAWFRIDGEREIELRRLSSTRDQFASLLGQVPPDQVFTLLTEPDPVANACLVWNVGQSGLEAITPPNSNGSAKTGNFIMFVPDQQKNDFCELEDGIALLLTNSSAATIRAALQSGKDISVPISKELNLRIGSIEQDYHDPISGEVYHSESGWHEYLPQGGFKPKPSGPVLAQGTVLLTAQGDMAKRITVEALVGYMKLIEKAVVDEFSPLPGQPSQELVIQCELHPEGWADIKMGSKPGISDHILQDLYNRMSAIDTPKVSGGTVKFELLYAIWGGSGNSPDLAPGN